MSILEAKKILDRFSKWRGLEGKDMVPVDDLDLSTALTVVSAYIHEKEEQNNDNRT